MYKKGGFKKRFGRGGKFADPATLVNSAKLYPPL